MFCGMCGKQISDFGKFCPFCGAKVAVVSAPLSSDNEFLPLKHMNDSHEQNTSAKDQAATAGYYIDNGLRISPSLLKGETPSGASPEPSVLYEPLRDTRGSTGSGDCSEPAATVAMVKAGAFLDKVKQIPKKYFAIAGAVLLVVVLCVVLISALKSNAMPPQERCIYNYFKAIETDDYSKWERALSPDYLDDELWSEKKLKESYRARNSEFGQGFTISYQIDSLEPIYGETLDSLGSVANEMYGVPRGSISEAYFYDICVVISGPEDQWQKSNRCVVFLQNEQWYIEPLSFCWPYSEVR